MSLSVGSTQVLIVAMLDINVNAFQHFLKILKVLIVAMLDVNDTTMADLVSDL